jgi:dolichol-phosphate mannosyltransferase
MRSLEKELSLILPTLNEAENIVPQIREILSAVPEIKEILVVDDASSDGTPGIIREELPELLAQEKVRILERTTDLGLTPSLREGIAASRGTYIGWMDCDLSMPADLIPSLLERIDKGADVCMGTRFAYGGQKKKILEKGKDSIAETLLSSALNKLLHLIIRSPISDYTSGYIISRKSVLSSISLHGSHGEYFIRLVVDLCKNGAKLDEIPYKVKNRLQGSSKTFGTWQAVLKNSFRYLKTFGWAITHAR